MKKTVYIVKTGIHETKPTTDIFLAQERYLAAFKLAEMIGISSPEMKVKEMEVG